MKQGRKHIQDSVQMLALVTTSCIAFQSACAEPVEDFYKGRSVEVIISGGTGSTYDLGTRLITRYMSRYIAGDPKFVPKLMQGGGHLIAANYMYNVAPKDGSSIASVGETVPMAPLLTPQQAKFDASKYLWIGNSQITNNTLITWHTSNIKTLEDAKKRTVTTGSTGAGSPSAQVPTMLNNILGTKFKVISGYTSPNIELAMERGELDARGSVTVGRLKSVRADWIRDGKVNLLFLAGLKQDPAFPNVPLLHTFARNQAERLIFRFISSSAMFGRSLLAPPDVPSDRIAALRQAFDRTMIDKEFLAEAEKMGYEVNVVGWADLQATAAEVAQTPKDVLALVQAAHTPDKDFQCRQIVEDKSLCDTK